MDKFLTNLDFKNPDFYNYSVENVYPKVNDFISNINDSKDETKQLLDSISLLIKLTSSFTVKTHRDLEIESAHGYLIKVFVNQLQIDKFKAEDINHIVQIFDQISSFKTQTVLRINIFSQLLGVFSGGENLVKKFGSKSFSAVIHSIKVNFRLDKQYLIACFEQDSQNDLKQMVDTYRSHSEFSAYRFTLEKLFDLDQEQFTQVLPDIQGFFEFCVRNHNNPFLPYRFIIDKLIRIVSYFKIEPKSSLYYNLPQNPKNTPKISQLIDLLKEVFIKANHSDDDIFSYYDAYTVQKFASQINNLFEYADPTHGHSILIENWRTLYDAWFEIYAKAVRNDLRCSIPRLELKKVMSKSRSKFKDIKQFNLYLFEKLTELTRYLNSNFKDIDSKSPQFPSCLDSYYSFSRDMIEYIAYEVNDVKTCCGPCMVYLVELSKSAHLSTDFLRVIYDLLWKDNFFVLKDYPKETLILTENLAKLLYEFASSEEKLEEPVRKRYDLVSKAFNYLKDRISKFPESKQLVQECLFEQTFYKPVILNVTSENFFYLVEYLFDLFDAQLVVTKLKSEFSKVLAVFVSNSMIETIQAEAPNKYRLSAYYNSWFDKLGEVLKTSNELPDSSIMSLIDVLKQIDNMDDYIDAFDSNSFTVNYRIVQSLSKSFENPNSNPKLVAILVNIWIKLYEKDVKEFTERFLWVFTSVANNFGKIAAPVVGQLWEFFLKDIKKHQLCSILETLLPQTHSVFMEKYRQKYTEALLNEFDQSCLNNFSILMKFIKYCPKFYFFVDNDKLVLTRFVQKSKFSTEENLYSTVVSLFNQVLMACKDDPKLFGEVNEIIFNRRDELWEAYFAKTPAKNITSYEVIPTKGFSIEWVASSIGEIYLLLLKNSTSKDKKSVAKLLVDELLQYFSKTVPESNRPFEIIDIIRRIGEINNKAYLDVVREHKGFFMQLRTKTQSEPNALNSVNSVIDLIEGRNLETFSNKLNQNEQNIEKINENLAEKDAEIKALDENIRSNEQNINTLKGDVDQVRLKVDELGRIVEQQNVRISQLDEKTLFNIPPWCKRIKSSMVKNHQDWILVAKRLNFSDRDIKAWLNQIDPFMSMLQEWFIANKTSDAIIGLMKVFKELNNKECVQIIQDNMDRIETETKSSFKDYNIDDKLKKNPANVFLCFEWSSKQKAELLQRYLFESINKQCGVKDLNDADNRVNIWFDDGSMGGGVERNKRIDLGVRLCNVLVCLITSETNKDKNCLNQINLAIQLNKPIIPLLLDSKLKWPPSGSLGPILSEYLFIRFFQRPPKELTNDERFWPVDKFNELTMQLKQLIPFSLPNTTSLDPDPSPAKIHPEVFISYQWDKQKEIIKLYEKLTNLGMTCWLDIYQMGGGDSLYFKIDEGIRNCSVVISCVTTRYSQSANCRKEIALSDSVSKPIIPILIEKGMKYPPPGPMSPTLGALKVINFTSNMSQNENISWDGKPFTQLLEAMKPFLSKKTIETVTSRACVIS